MCTGAALFVKNFAHAHKANEYRTMLRICGQEKMPVYLKISPRPRGVYRGKWTQLVSNLTHGVEFRRQRGREGNGKETHYHHI